MKISIITVSFNSGRTIADTLKSVAAQTYPDIEHIVIDGGSRDDTAMQVRLHGVRVSHFVSEPDRGIYDAMNKGLKLATGEFVGFLNADDTLASPDALAGLAKAMPTCDVVYADLVYVKAADTSRVVRHWVSGGYTPTRLRFGWMPPHPTFYVRRAVLDGIQFDLRYRIAADYDFMLRCLRKANVRIDYVPQVFVRMRNGGASNRSLKALWRKSREDLLSIKKNGVGGVWTLAAKNLRKVYQFIVHS